MANGIASSYGSQLRHASVKFKEAERYFSARKSGAYRRPHETFAAEVFRDRPIDQ